MYTYLQHTSAGLTIISNLTNRPHCGNSRSISFVIAHQSSCWTNLYNLLSCLCIWTIWGLTALRPLSWSEVISNLDVIIKGKGVLETPRTSRKISISNLITYRDRPFKYLYYSLNEGWSHLVIINFVYITIHIHIYSYYFPSPFVLLKNFDRAQIIQLHPADPAMNAGSRQLWYLHVPPRKEKHH